MVASARDAMFMERALLLAERGRGRTSPNPIVGAVVVTQEGIVVGQGSHLDAGGPHAEVHALNAAGGRARGGTLYCTLEPCCHVGRTGPCTTRIAEAGISRVVAAVQDPNPRVAGGGFAHLRERGIEITEGEAAAQAAAQNAPFFTWVRHRRPFVTLKVAVSADGFVGQRDRRVKLTGPAADRWFHRQRAEVDAIAVGSGTVLVDDPRLTAREVYRYRPLTRVIFDRSARTPLSARVFDTLAAGPVIMVVSRRVTEERHAHLEALAQRGIAVLSFEEDNIAPALAELASRGVVSLLVEGGPTLQNAFITAGLVDRVQRVSTATPLGTGVPMPGLSHFGARLEHTVTLGPDCLTEFDVHRAH